jgi:hypothetical protein
VVLGGRVREWAADQQGWRRADVRCIRRGLRRVVLRGRGSGQGWVRVRDSDSDLDLGSDRAWAVRQHYRHRVRRHGHSVRDREDAEGRVTRRAKKVR